MKIFITGASGFVGKSLVEDLLDQDHVVHGLARNNQSAQIIQALGAVPLKGDLLAINQFKSQLADYDAIIHTAAKIKFTGGLEDFFDINVKATKELVEAAIEAKVKTFIYTSAAAIALDGNPLINITEEYQPQKMIKSSYLQSKRLAEQELLKHQDEIRIIILRPPIIWGPKMGIMEAFRSTISKIGFPTIGDPKHHLPTCHLKNLNAAIISSLPIHHPTGIYLVCDEEQVQVRPFMNKLIKAYGMNMGNMHLPKRIALSMADFVEFIWKTFKLNGNPPMSNLIVHLMGTEFTIDYTKAKKVLGYQPVISVAEGLRQLPAPPE